MFNLRSLFNLLITLGLIFSWVVIVLQGKQLERLTNIPLDKMPVQVATSLPAVDNNKGEIKLLQHDITNNQTRLMNVERVVNKLAQNAGITNEETFSYGMGKEAVAFSLSLPEPYAVLPGTDEPVTTIDFKGMDFYRLEIHTTTTLDKISNCKNTSLQKTDNWWGVAKPELIGGINYCHLLADGSNYFGMNSAGYVDVYWTTKNYKTVILVFAESILRGGDNNDNGVDPVARARVVKETEKILKSLKFN